MTQNLIKFIPIGETGSVCYLFDNLKDFENKNEGLFQSYLKDWKTKKIQRFIILKSLTKQIDYDSISNWLATNGFPTIQFSPDLDFKKQVQIFENLLDNLKSNIGILFWGASPSLFDLVVKISLYIDKSNSASEVYYYLTEEEPNSIAIDGFKKFQNFLESDPYLLTKPDRAEFKRLTPLVLEKIETKSALSAEEANATTAFTLNLSSLSSSVSDDVPLLTETSKINFNLESLVESDFKKEESAEEHYDKIKSTQRHEEIDDSLSLDVDLAGEIEYISSLESLPSNPTLQRISAVNLDTVSKDNIDLPKQLNPTIDYKTKEYLDFDAIINDEIEQEEAELNAKFFLDEPDHATNLFIEEDNDSQSIIEVGNSAIDLDIVETKAKIDLSFPPPIQDLEDLLDEEMELENESKSGDLPVDPSQTFLVKRINDVIQKEVLSEDSKGKIPVSNITKINTESLEAIPSSTNPNSSKVSNPKISSPKFNPITLDD